MTFQPNIPPSMMLRMAREAEASSSASAPTEGDMEAEQRKRREEYKKTKELEEARKAGTVPAMQDEEGKYGHGYFYFIFRFINYNASISTFSSLCIGTSIHTFLTMS